VTYYFSKTVAGTFEDVVALTEAALKAEGFGIIMEIDIKKTFSEKLGVPFRNYRILGACNPKLAHEALALEDKIGTMLPCNVVFQEAGRGQVEVAAIDPSASMQAVNNPQLKEAAGKVGKMLKTAIEKL
jgi:uncharacterized protein (DUF302 family)